MGSLIRPEPLPPRPEVLQAALDGQMGLDLDQLGVVDVLDEDNTLGEIELNTRPTLRFHGSIPALTDQLRTLMASEARIVLAASHQGDVERLATVLREYQIPYRLGSRNPHPGETMLDESSYLAGDRRGPRRGRALWGCASPSFLPAGPAATRIPAKRCWMSRVTWPATCACR